MSLPTYDFVLFENFIGASNHYTDIMIIARMLKYAGYKVAILNYYDEKVYCKNEEIPLLEFKNECARPDISWTYRPMNPLFRVFHVLKFNYEQHRYAKFFLQQIKGLAKNYYIGSYHLSMSSLFFTQTDPKANYFIWGLRSSRMTDIKSKVNESLFSAYKSLLLRMHFKSRKNFNLFVSNELIRKEFIQLGIQKEKLILRPERVIEHPTIDNINLLSENFNLLTIGYLRKEKQVEMCLNAISRLNNNELTYTIAGRCNIEYEYVIKASIESNYNKNNIIRINSFIEEKAYKELIEKSHFVVLCDKRQASLVTNGTMMEALILNRPIIAPNYLPYSYYVNKYHIGLLFEPEDIDSLKMQILKAKELGTNYFASSIKEFQKTLLFDKCADEFMAELNECVNN